MDFETYKGSLAQDAPPGELGFAAQALWWEAKGDWHQAHQCAQKQADTEGAWAHAICTASKAICRTPAAGTAAPGARPRPPP
jgi:hypothetical protein